ncbi:MAG TPA: phytanoyl-CoA dioxygenase family protein [Allosphingosinicella sp.]|uniref:phytanoyl-CoA dioxygenase family protein n=1 Tax=Allosphingosinicella sp. TaxID=2823234 RepID=UPI002EDA293B
MGFGQPLRRDRADYREDYVESYWRDGFAIIRGLFSPDEIVEIGAAADQVHAEGAAHGRSFRHGNLFYNVASGPGGEPLVRMAQWMSYHQPVLNAVRLDRRIAAILDPLIGPNLKQIINQIHWKAPGPSNDFAWHQDSRFREPREAFRNLGTSYVQTGLAIDPHTPTSGCLRVVPGSHLRGSLDLDCSGEVLGNAMSDETLRAVGLPPADVIELVMAPGDFALWSPYLVHGSGENKEQHRRRFYINGYVRAADCDRGEWAFRGQPVPFGPKQALVHYEALRERPEPHYPS